MILLIKIINNKINIIRKQQKDHKLIDYNKSNKNNYLIIVMYLTMIMNIMDSIIKDGRYNKII